MPRAHSSHYKRLGLPPTAERDEVDKAFKELVLNEHPDNPRPENLERKSTLTEDEVEEQYINLCNAYQAIVAPQTYDDLELTMEAADNIFFGFFSRVFDNAVASHLCEDCGKKYYAWLENVDNPIPLSIMYGDGLEAQVGMQKDLILFREILELRMKLGKYVPRHIDPLDVEEYDDGVQYSAEELQEKLQLQREENKRKVRVDKGGKPIVSRRGILKISEIASDSSKPLTSKQRKALERQRQREIQQQMEDFAKKEKEREKMRKEKEEKKAKEKEEQAKEEAERIEKERKEREAVLREERKKKEEELERVREERRKRALEEEEKRIKEQLEIERQQEEEEKRIQRIEEAKRKEVQWKKAKEERQRKNFERSPRGVGPRSPGGPSAYRVKKYVYRKKEPELPNTLSEIKHEDPEPVELPQEPDMTVSNLGTRGVTLSMPGVSALGAGALMDDNEKDVTPGVPSSIMNLAPGAPINRKQPDMEMDPFSDRFGSSFGSSGWSWS